MRHFIILALVFLLTSCSATKAVFAMMKNTADFHALKSDPRIKYETGAKSNAKLVSANLDKAIRKIVARQYAKFVKPVVVYMPGTVKSFESFCVARHAGGCVINGRLFISPKKKNTPARIPSVLAHELSHLQMQQILGMWKWHENTPAWFREGLAVYASDGGGAEGVSSAQAKQAILSGYSITPNNTGSLLFPKTAHRFGLKPHMFYKQAELFVSWLHQLDHEKFRKLVLSIQAGATFADAMQNAYGTSTQANWKKFLHAIKG